MQKLFSMKYRWLFTSFVFSVISLTSAFANEDPYLRYKGIYGTLATSYTRLFIDKTKTYMQFYQAQTLNPDQPDRGTYYKFAGTTSGLFPAPSGLGVALIGGGGYTFFDNWLYVGGEFFYQYVGGNNDSTVYSEQKDPNYGGVLDKVLFYSQIKTEKLVSYNLRVGSIVEGTLLYLKMGYKMIDAHIIVTYGAQSNLGDVKALEVPGRYLDNDLTFKMIEVGIGAERKFAPNFSVRGEMTYGFAQASIPLILNSDFNKLDATLDGKEMLITMGISYYFFEF